MSSDIKSKRITPSATMTKEEYMKIHGKIEGKLLMIIMSKIHQNE